MARRAEQAHSGLAMQTFTPYDDVRWKTFNAHQDSDIFMWAFGRSAKSAVWFLRDHDGYIRALASTWIDSVPMIHAVLDNYGMTAAVN